jgi:all-trans-retinol 13,14-reductase
VNRTYDYLILGGGMGGLSTGALLAQAGRSVCLLDRHHTVGGYAHTIQEGRYSFCHAVQYLMGCAPGGPIDRFLAMLNLSEVVEFHELDRDGFDVIAFDGLQVSIPHGAENYKRRLQGLYPEHASGLERYFSTAEKIFQERQLFRRAVTKWDILLHPLKHPTIIRFRNYTLQRFFDELGFPPALQSILAGQYGNVSICPRHASLVVYLIMQFGFCSGAHYPKKGMKFLIDRIVDKITGCGGTIVTDCAVQRLHVKRKRITHVETTRGELFGHRVISNIDPQCMAGMVFPLAVRERLEKRMRYEYTESVFSIHLGLRDVDLSKYGFGRRNIWHHPVADINAAFDVQVRSNDYSRPGLFISTPSLLTDEGVYAPRGCHTMQIMTLANFAFFDDLYRNNREKYEETRESLADRILDIIEDHYFPDLRRFIEVRLVHTPVDIFGMLAAPQGNIYGVSNTPKHYPIGKGSVCKPIKNLYMVGATSSFHGIIGTVVGSLNLFDRLERTPRFRLRANN